MKKILIIFMVAIISIACVGCGDTNSSQESSTEAPPASNSDSSKNENLEYKAGDVINFEGEEITLTNVQKNYNTGNQYSKPASGKEFIKVTVTIKNVSNENISVNPLEFKIQTSNGVQESVSGETYSLDDKFISAELISQGTITGSIIFETPKDDSSLKLVYQPNLFKGKQISINL